MSRQKRRNATQVVRRALVLAAVVCRGFIEIEGAADPNEVDALHTRILEWLTQFKLWDAVEPGEEKILRTPLGQLQHAQVIQATWSVEGLAILAWALKLMELPRHDQEVGSCDVTETVWFLCDDADELIRTARLRKGAELKACRELHYHLHVRLAQYRRNRTLMDFNNWIEQADLDALGLDRTQLVLNNDLILQGKEIREVEYEQVQKCEWITCDRHRATIWLIGEYPIYSELPVDT